MLRTRVLRSYFTGLPWRVDPVDSDSDYWPWDRRVRLWYETLKRTTLSVGALAYRNAAFAEIKQIGDTSAADKQVGVQGTRMGASNAPLIRMEPMGNQTVESFVIKTDQLLGGHSEAFVDVTEDNHILFHGTLRVTRDPVRMSMQTGYDVITDEHVGFAVMEHIFHRYWWGFQMPTRGVEIRCRGSEHPFYLKIRTMLCEITSKQYFAHMFVPTDEWRCYVLRYDHFRSITHGGENKVSGRRETARLYGDLRMIGLGLNCGEEDDFWIEVDYIRSVLMTPEEVSSGSNKDEYSQDGEHYKHI
eukprot:Rhum_TRINITY_DN3772_c0_g1::Rhum_TRINITY_DN3772_c0_g1_i1::g.11936::m.11936/K18159/NDUFAF1, CIA30; NADH dehydrogenase [ubiquinone] 1 alpha subcomplex assembly factor 1